MSAAERDIQFIKTFGDLFERLIVKMQEVDDWCVQATQEISKQELSLIGFIANSEEELIMRDIAEFLEVPFSTSTGIIDKLVDKDYLKRVHSEKDRRIVHVKPTQKGDDLNHTLVTKKMEMGTKIARALSGDERTLMLDLLKKVTTNL